MKKFEKGQFINLYIHFEQVACKVIDNFPSLALAASSCI